MISLEFQLKYLFTLRLAILFMIGWYLGARAARGAKRPPPF
jgi:hypothetical protein